MPYDFIYGDALPTAPRLAPRGHFGVGVKTLALIHPNQIDILRSTPKNPQPRYDRPLTVEVWYPAQILLNEPPLTQYEDWLGDTTRGLENRRFYFRGRALREAPPDRSGGPYPLVIVSHGYPGSRYMMTNLTENLASKGYVVVAIDHTESTFADAEAVQSALLNRALDQQFILNTMATLGTTTDQPWSGLIDAANTGLIGFSMGAFGTLNVAGMGYNPVLVNFVGGEGAAAPRAAANPQFVEALDERVKATVVFAPFGADLSSAGFAGLGFWDDEGFAGLRVPTFFFGGSHDAVAGYSAGPHRIFEKAVNAERYFLTYHFARHHIAQNPPPSGDDIPYEDYLRYAEPVWDVWRLNNINQHFVTAFLGHHLKGEDYARYLTLPEDGQHGWEGFAEGTALGMTLEHRGRGD